MNIKLLGKNLQDIRKLLPEFGMVENDQDFELVVTHGGDGALLGAEREFPGIPKLPLRDAATAPTCCEHLLRRRLENFCNGSFSRTSLPKITAVTNSGKLIAVNDLTLHNSNRASALRYRITIDGELYAKEVMGDGICFSTVHGSTAYYRSITGSIFRVGVGLAFSNSTEAVDHLVLDASSTVTVTILRGPGLVIADNSPTCLPVAEGESVEFRQTSDTALIYGLDEFMCHECRKLRHRNKY